MTNDIYLTDREADVMQVLWDHGPRWSTRSRTSSHDELAYTTVLTILRTLEQKGYVKHEEEGRVHRYAAAVKENAARKSALQHLTGKAASRARPSCCSRTSFPTRSSPTDQIKRMRDLLARAPKTSDSRRK